MRDLGSDLGASLAGGAHLATCQALPRLCAARGVPVRRRGAVPGGAAAALRSPTMAAERRGLERVSGQGWERTLFIARSLPYVELHQHLDGSCVPCALHAAAAALARSTRRGSGESERGAGGARRCF